MTYPVRFFVGFALIVFHCAASFAVHPLFCVLETRDLNALERLQSDGLLDLVDEEGQTLLDLALTQLGENDTFTVRLLELGARRANELQGLANSNISENDEVGHAGLSNLFAHLPRRNIVLGSGESIIQLAVDAVRTKTTHPRMSPARDLEAERRKVACFDFDSSTHVQSMLDLQQQLQRRSEMMTFRSNYLPPPEHDEGATPWYNVREAPRDVEPSDDTDSSVSEEVSD